MTPQSPPRAKRARITLATVVGTAAAILGFAGALALVAELGALVGHGVHAVEHSLDSLTPPPGSLGGWLAIYIGVWGLVSACALAAARGDRARVVVVLCAVAVIGMAYYLLTKTEPFVYANAPAVVHSCGSWLSPTQYTSTAQPISYCVVKLDGWFRWAFAVGVGGLALMLMYTYDQQKPAGAKAAAEA